MKKSVVFSIVLILIISLIGCSSESSSSSKKESKKEETNKEVKLLSKEEFTKMYSDPKKYKGSKVEFFAKIFVDPEKDDKGTYMQVYAENNSEKNTIVAIKDPNIDVKVDDIIFISGKVEDAFEGENAMGGTITAPTILADKVEKSDYATAFAPAIKTVDVNQNIDQHGFVLNISKIEIAENETRLFVDITNNSNDTISFYSFNSKLVVNDQQLETSDNYEAGYPEIQSEILPGIKTQGILTFPKVAESGSLKVYMEGSSNNYELEFQPFQFEVTY
ncbi:MULTISPECIES: DUF4352 domain-containing protein [unclassified Bacillus (in: firmicutes)]|uniref:DUF4352 domain-containing protein n=1 Tax=unclassified Bacillus (in: firmicutes) TaxID=185979 RepID=UPI0008E4E727|nr:MULTISPECIES: DUF4352 domain-containing protein [unclassified Bacillus (in: firmicutes)]SFB11454.1 hypothetical protein SAMN02799634_1062 [Bacillus sp. UNCCL13]SFQ90531.1 hypothetical protein SAMN04488577_3814 [Bacillus sp. cl95]